MAGNVSLNTVTDGLVMYLDAANTKSLADVPSQNLFTYSQQFDTWSKLRATITGTTLATTAPDGTSTAQKIIEDTTSGVTHFFTKAPTISGTGTTYTVSIYAKAAERTWLAIQIGGEDPNYITAYFDLINGVLGSVGTGITAAISNVGNGWYRCSITRLKQGTISSTIGGAFCISPTNLGFTYNGDGTSGIYVWGGQMEVGNVATTYIPTTTAAASRIPTWTDISRGGNNGTLTSGFTYNYSNGGSLVFDGVSNYVTIPNSDNIVFGNGDFTANVWIKFPLSSTGEGGAWGPILSKGCNTAAPAGTWWIAQTTSLTNRVTLNISSTTGGTFVTSLQSNDFSDGWHNICVNRNGATSFMYSDGILIRTDTTSESNLSSIKPLTIGATFITGITTQRTNTSMGITQIYNRALSAAEVLQNYNAAKSRFGL